MEKISNMIEIINWTFLFHLIKSPNSHPLSSHLFARHRHTNNADIISWIYSNVGKGKSMGSFGINFLVDGCIGVELFHFLDLTRIEKEIIVLLEKLEDLIADKY